MAFLPANYGGDLVNLDVQIKVEIPPKLIDDISEEFLAGLPKVLNQIGILGHTYWTKLASERLSSSRRDYIRALSYVVIGNSVQLTLGGSGVTGKTNTFVLAVELGGPRFDMKPGFLNSPKAKTGGPRKFPKHLRDQLKRNPAPVRYMIVPIVKDRSVVASGPNVKFRTVHSNQSPSLWWHPGWKGVQISQDVIREINEVIVPEAFKPLLEGL